ncbi:MAG: cupin domain-containing protein, partial [Trebonia sp.]
LDGLDIPFAYYTESTFFEPGSDEPPEPVTPRFSRSERLWAHPGLTPLSQSPQPAASPLLAYRWVHTDRALAEQLALEEEGYEATVEPGHAAVRFTNPATGRDVLPTMRAQFHRLRAGAGIAERREVGSSIYQVFDGSGLVHVGSQSWTVGRGDVFVVPSWQPLRVQADRRIESDSGGLDLFQFSDAPVFEAVHAMRVQVGGERE